MRTLLILSQFMFLIHAYGQEKKQVYVRGAVVDSLHTIVPSAVTFLLRAKDSGRIKETVTDKEGRYLFINVDQGEYIIAVSQLGYDETYSGIVFVDDSPVQVPDIILINAVKELAGVTVLANKRLIEVADDKLIYNAENDPLASSERAADLFRKIPLLDVDVDGNVTLNGQSNFRVLLNGRETSMFSRNLKDALKGFPGSLIRKVEVITNPSAKYDAEGVGGIINIITRKKVLGYNGTLSVDDNTLNAPTASISLSFKYGRFGIVGNYGLGGNFGLKQNGSDEIEALRPIAFYKRFSNKTNVQSNHSGFGNLEISYEIDSLHVLSAYISPGGGNVSNESSIDFFTVRTATPDTMKTTYHSQEENIAPLWNTGLDYIQKFKSHPDKEFSIRLNGDFGKDNTNNASQQYSSSGNRFILNNNRANNRQYTIESDYVLPVKKSDRIEAGAKFIFRRAMSDYNSFIKYAEQDDYKQNALNSDAFHYAQNVYSLYMTYVFKLGKVGVRFGGRFEHTIIAGDFIHSNKTIHQDYSNIVPNLLLSGKVKNVHNVSLGYSMRLQRPYIYSLNPFLNNLDSLDISTGNPSLKPQTIHTVSLQDRVSTGKTFISIAFNNSYSNNKISTIMDFDPVSGITTSMPVNSGVANQTFFTVGVNTSLNAKWRMNINGRASYDVLKNGGSTDQINSGFSGSIGLNTSYVFNSRLTATLFSNAAKRPLLLQGFINGYFFYGVGGRYKLSDKITFTCSFNNFHHAYYQRITSLQDQDFKRKTIDESPVRAFNFGLAWNFGKLKENISQKKGVNNDDLIK